MNVYIAVAQIWTSDTTTIPIPIMGVFATAEDAQNNAYAVLAKILTAEHPDLLQHPVTVVATPIPDTAVRDFLTTLGAARPDLMKTPRGKAK